MTDHVALVSVTAADITYAAEAFAQFTDERDALDVAEHALFASLRDAGWRWADIAAARGYSTQAAQMRMRDLGHRIKAREAS